MYHVVCMKLPPSHPLSLPPSLPVHIWMQHFTAPSNNDALIAVGIGVGVGVPVVLAVILVIVCVVYCTSKGERLEYNNIIMFSPLLCSISILYTPLNPDLQVETQGEGRGRSGPVCWVVHVR